jgi:hypothetical protein
MQHIIRPEAQFPVTALSRESDALFHELGADAQAAR